jgi:hypothetical protein
VPNYTVNRGLGPSPNDRVWPVGPMPDRATALATFNSVAQKEGLGEFSFDETAEGAEYFLAEKIRTPVGTKEDWIPIFKL